MSLSSLLRALGDVRSIAKARMVHAKFIVSSFLPDVVVSNHLMSMYVRYNNIEHARKLFDRMPEKNVVSWTILIDGYSKLGPVARAVSSFRSMVSSGCRPNDFTYVAVLVALASIGAERNGKEIHARIYRVEGGVFSSYVSNSLVNLYAKCGMMHVARRVFEGTLQLNLVSWGSILSGYCQCGENEEALRLFLHAWGKGKQMHCLVIKSGHGRDLFVEAGIVDMYVKYSELDSAGKAFFQVDTPGLASWAALLGGFAHQGQSEQAMTLFLKLHSSGLKPNEHIFPSILISCSALDAIGEGKQLHSLITKLGYTMAAYVGNALIDFYAKCGLFNDSLRVFQEMEERDSVSWNSMIARHIDRGNLVGAMDLLKQMFFEGIDPDLYTYSTILKLCADLPALGWGRQTHSCIIKPRTDKHVVIGSALIDMYAKCGRLNDARKVFDILSCKNRICWNAMLVGYAQHGFGNEALDIFKMMQMESITPNDISFIGVLTACAHMGLVEQGQFYFSLMKKYQIIPQIDHFACMVDLFARAGKINVAYEFIKSMPMEPSKVIWRSLLAGCRVHGQLSIGKNAAEYILDIDSADIPTHLMLSSTYANAGLLDNKAEAREVEKMGSKKVPGCSWIEINNKIHCFLVGDAVLGSGDQINETLSGLAIQMADLICHSDRTILHNKDRVNGLFIKQSFSNLYAGAKIL
ncbi:pentatricopeptide repeat-containing protein At3g53360, mitochondrial-like isoform X2 [Typha latifolia]|uniref:pentatricopeptide repeat-containing protein At3g53360, mitochondrial-like isoform X2 n=1 Tax=Typha latifolia TaxID=4733 RepID=UPI003C2DD8C0